MAIQTLEKNSIFKYFEIYKDKFFKILMLNVIFFTAVIIVALLSVGIGNLLPMLFSAIGIAEPLKSVNLYDFVLTLIAFLPTILLGGVIGAVTKMCREYVREEPGFFLEDLKRAYVSNWKQCTLIALLQYVLIIALSVAIPFYSASPGSEIMGIIGLGVSVFVAVVAVFASYYAYMMAVTLKLRLYEILKNSLIFAFLCFFRNLLLSVILLIWIGLTALLIYGMVVSANALLWGLGIAFVMLLFFGFIFYTIAFFVFPSIKRYILDPYYEKHPEETAAGLKKIESDEIDYAAQEEKRELPEFVYHNGKMVHRSVFEEEPVFNDQTAVESKEQNRKEK